MIQNVIDTTSEFWPIPYFLPYLNAVDQVSRQIGELITHSFEEKNVKEFLDRGK